jgi:hypothetical protein
MTNRRTSDLTALSAIASTDLVALVDVSDVTYAVTGTDKKATISDLATAVATAGGLATTSAVAAGYQPLDSDLTAIAALTTTSFGLAFLALADAAAGRTALGLGNLAAATTINEYFCIAVGDETTAITTGTGKVTFRMPFALTVTAVRASLTTASSSGTPTIDINEGAGAGTSILSTKLTIDANELTSTTAATAAVISDSALADDANITIDIDVAGTGAAGLKVWIFGTRAV